MNIVPFRRRPRRFTSGEVRLTLLSGVLLGLVAMQMPDWYAPTGENHFAQSQPPDTLDPWEESRMSREISEAQEGPLERLPRESGVGADADVIDGDTFRYAGETIRIADIDTPETHPPRCAFEARLGARATRRLEELLAAGRFELLPAADGRDTDRYGRKLRVVFVDGRSVGGILVAEGLAREYAGGRRPWCA